MSTSPPPPPSSSITESSTVQANGRATPCIAEPPIELARPGESVLGVWATPGDASGIQWALARGSTVALARREADGARTITSEAALWPGAVATSAWRSAGGIVLISLREGARLRLGRWALPSALQPVVFAAGARPNTADWVLAPLDDPSASRFLGFLGATELPASEVGSLAISEFGSDGPVAAGRRRPWYREAKLRRTAGVGPDGMLLLVRVWRAEYGPERAVELEGQENGPIMLGELDRASNLPETARHPHVRIAPERSSDVDVRAGGPMLAVVGSQAIVVWVERGGALLVQRIDLASGAVRDEPERIAGPAAMLNDLTVSGTDVVISVNAANAPGTNSSHMSRLIPLRLAAASAAGQRTSGVLDVPSIPIARAQLVPIAAGRVLCWSPDTRQAMVVHCL